MKKLAFVLAGILFALTIKVQAQTHLYTNDFESYTAGSAAALSMGAPWTTWSNNPGGADDAAFSSTQAHSGTKSIKIINDDDLVYQFNDKTTGRYVVEWYMYVEANKLGYFNFLSDFAGSNSKWALQVYVSHDSLIVDAAGQGAGLATTFTHDVWHLLQVIIDLDDDFTTFYLDGTEVISYKWSLGAYGSDNTLKLDGIDFYGWSANGFSAGYYIDDINIDSVASPTAPSNLTAVVNGANIDVNWTAPVPAPDLYKLSCNGSVIYSGINQNYTDLAPWPFTYHYKARAHYNGQGYSHSSNEDSATITGGISRDLVLMEGGTGLWCGYCPGAAMGLRDLIEVNNKDAVAIEYHSGDSLEFPEALNRIDYYNMTGFPTVVADGRLVAVGGSATVSQYPRYLNMYNQRIVYPGHHDLDLNIVETTPGNFEATITINQIYQAQTSGIKLRCALTESNLPIAWGNQSEADFVCRALFPDDIGTDLDFSVSNPLVKTINFTLGGHVKNNCEFVAFVQYDAMKEVTQAAKVDMASVLGVREIKGERINIYPNPASEYIIAGTTGKGLLQITDMAGKVVISRMLTETSQVIDVRGLSRGLYIIKVDNGDKTFVEKLIKE